MDHIPIATCGQEPDGTTLALCDHGPWPWSAVPDRSAWDDEVGAQAEVAAALIARGVSAWVEQTGGWVMCLSLPVSKHLPDRCPNCGSLEIRYGGRHAACCSSCGRIADEAVFEVGPCQILAADHDRHGWGASLQVIETGDCLGDTWAAGLNPLAPAGAHPGLIADVLLALDWPEIIRRSVGCP